MGAVSKLLKATVMNGQTGVKGILQCAVCALGTKVTAALLFSCKHLTKEEEKKEKTDSNEIVVNLHKLKSRGSNHSNKYKYQP